MKHTPLRIAVLEGDGVGPEVTSEAVRVLKRAFESAGREAHFERAPFGGAAIDAVGVPFPEDTRRLCQSSSSVLLGAVGGPRWDDVEPDRRPERGLLQLRKTLGTFANIRPVRVPAALASRSPLVPELASGVDLVVVRELTGGIYFGPGREYQIDGQPAAEDAMQYSESEVARVARVAFEAARRRRNHVTSVDKANVLRTSRLWRRVVSEIHASTYRDVTLTHAYVDSTATQLVVSPRSFDVILTENLFGDILSDLAGAIPGSLGVLPSSSVGGGIGIYEPVHGSAPDIAGTGRANPLGAILSAAMLLDDAGEAAPASRVRAAVESALLSGKLTDDLAGAPGIGVSCSEMGDAVLAAMSSHTVVE